MITGPQYLAMRALLRAAVSSSAPLAANVSDAEVLQVFAQFFFEARAAGTLRTARQNALPFAFRKMLAATDSDVSDFFVQLQTDAANQVALATTRYFPIRAQFLASVQANVPVPGPAEQTMDCLASYLAAMPGTIVGFAYTYPGGVAPISPALMPGLRLWLDGTQSKFADAGSTPAPVPFTRVQRIPQPSPLTGSWNAFSSTTRPFPEANALDCHCGDPELMQPPVFSVVHNDGCSVGFSAQIRASHITNLIWGATASDGTQNYMSVQSDVLVFTHENVSINTGIAVPPGAPVLTAVLTITSSTVAIKGYVGGVAFDYSSAYASAATTWPTIGVGFNSGVRGHMAAAQCVFMDGALSAANRDGLLAYLVQNQATDPPISAPLVVLSGDSIAAGDDFNTFQYATQFALNGNATPPRVIGAAIHGSVISLLQTQYSTYLQQLRSASRTKNIIAFQGITNSINCDTPDVATTAAAFLAAYYALCDQAKAAGWIVVLTTCLPANNVLKGTGFEACRQVVNTSILANYLSHGAAVCDFGNQPGMTTTADANGVNFNPVDHIHVTAAGYAVMATAFTATITALL